MHKFRWPYKSFFRFFFSFKKLPIFYLCYHPQPLLQILVSKTMETNVGNDLFGCFRFSNKHVLDISLSSQSTLRKSGRSQRSSVNEEVTMAVFTFCDEQFPYRTKIPGTQVTLRQFKEYLPKKGNYRLDINSHLIAASF